MNLETDIAIYLVIWWTALFAILPLGVKSHAEAGIPVPGGGDPAAPGKPATRSGDFRGTGPEDEEAERALVMADPFWGSCAHFEALRLCAQHRVARPGNR